MLTIRPSDQPRKTMKRLLESAESRVSRGASVCRFDSHRYEMFHQSSVALAAAGASGGLAIASHHLLGCRPPPARRVS